MKSWEDIAVLMNVRNLRSTGGPPKFSGRLSVIQVCVYIVVLSPMRTPRLAPGDFSWTPTMDLPRPPPLPKRPNHSN